jgi:hypothetical protein
MSSRQILSTARRIAQPPKATFVARLQPSQLPANLVWSPASGPIDNYPDQILPH